MNRDNLLAMANFIATIPQEKFTMYQYRESGKNKTHNCNSVGCVIGHSVILDKGFEQDPDYFRESNSEIIDFIQWSMSFTGLNGKAWLWCFGSSWGSVDNTPLGASKRILYLLENGVPDNIGRIIHGEAPLPY